MKKVGVLLILITGFLSFLYYYWYQATQLPQWYAQSHQSFQNVDRKVLETPQPNQENIEAKIEATINKSHTSKNIEVKFNEREVNHLVVSKMGETPDSRRLLAATKGFNTKIQDGTLSTGAVINISEIPVDKLETSEQAAIAKIIQTFPALKNQDVYIGVEGKPIVEKGQLKLDDNTKVKLGNLSFTVSELANQLGIPKAKLEQKINLELQLGRLKVSDIELTGNNAVVKGSVSQTPQLKNQS